MDKIFVSIDGANSTGKTHLLNNIVERNSLYYGIGLGENEKIINERWWFHESTPEELIDELLRMVKERATKCKQVKQPIIFLDKGLRTLQARLYSTFKIKGISNEKIEKYIKYFSDSYSEIMKENLFVLLENPFEIYDEDFFGNYNRIQSKYLKKFMFDITHEMKNNTDYAGSMLIDKLEQAIIEYLKKMWLNEVKRLQNIVMTLIGFDENENNLLIQYLKKEKEVWCIEYAYLEEYVKKKYDIFQENFLFHSLVFQELIIYLKGNNNCYVILKNPEDNFCIKAQSILGGQFKYINKFHMNVQVENFFGKNIGLYQVCNILEQIVKGPFEYRNLERKELASLHIESCFKKIIIDIEERVRERAGKNIALFSVVGSCAFESAIKDWSDIDILVILKQQDHNFQRFINKLPEDYSIHVGISCFTAIQIEIGEIDIKNQWNLYYIQNKSIVPNYIDSALCTRRMKLSELIEGEKNLLNEFKYMMKRMIYSELFSTRKLIKLTLNYVKVTLYKYNIIVNRMQNLLETLLIMWGVDYKVYFEINCIQEIDVKAAQKFATEVLEKVY